MKTRHVLAILALLAGGVLNGCAKKEVTSTQRKQAALWMSEAQFEVTMRDYARAEPLFAKAAELCYDTGDYWVALGSTRMRLGQRDGAKAAYKKALEAFEADAKQHKTEPQPMFQQIMTLALLGRVDDARSRMEKLLAQYPDSRPVKAYVESKQLDRMLADPAFKEVAL
jgi:tetratricopeptide (TPR) repeat protein